MVPGTKSSHSTLGDNKLNTKKYREFIDSQSELELGIYFYSEARRLLDDMVSAIETKKTCEPSQASLQIRTALKLSEQHLKKTRNEAFLSLTKRLNETLREMGI